MLPRSLERGGSMSADPIRKCILSGDREPRGELIRLALAPDGRILPDVRAKAPGRGAWIGVTQRDLEQATAKGRLRGALARAFKRSEEHTSELQSLMRISYAVFCLKKTHNPHHT